MRSGGFTLLEMLMAILLVAAASGLIAQTVFIVLRLEERLAGTQDWQQEQRLREAWLRDALAGLMATPASDPIRFRGDSTWLTGYTVSPPWPQQDIGPSVMTLRLIDRNGHTTLRVEPWQNAIDGWDLLQWTGRQGRWGYLDETGTWQARWPAGKYGDASRLPLAIRLEGPWALPWVFHLGMRGNPMLRRRDMDDDKPGS